jgi:hypothetical protein
MNIRMMLSIMIMTSPYWAHAMEQKSANGACQPLTVYALRDMDGQRVSQDYIRLMVDDGWRIDDEEDDAQRVRIVDLAVPATDFGQLMGILQVDTATRLRPAQYDVLLYGTDIGAATAINYIADIVNDQVDTRIKALILESPFASGNSALDHRSQNEQQPHGWMLHTHYARSFYTTPYLMKFLTDSRYDPDGVQPIKSIAKIPNEMLVILAHSKDNKSNAYEDSCALYYGLRAQGNENAYLITKEGEAHEEILHGVSEGSFIKNMLKKHKLIPGDYDASMDVSRYQPDHKGFKEIYAALLAKEEWHAMLGYGVNAVRERTARIAALVNRPEIRDNVVIPVALTVAGWAVRYAGNAVANAVDEQGNK